jgi:hypothetical protein
MKKTVHIISIITLLAISSSFFIPNYASAQINKNKKKSSFSSAGNKWSRFRYGVIGQVGSDIVSPVFLGLGFGANQYYGVGNLYFQQSVSYQISLGTKIRHSFEVSIHNNFFGGLDFSPFVWGANAMFVKDENIGQLFIRPDIGIAYPFKYRDKASEDTKITVLLLYGYNIKLFENQDDIGVGSNFITLKVLFSLFSNHEL